MTIFIEAVAIGLAIAAPVGPIGLLCIERTLHHGSARGLATGLGAATADAFYATVGATGMGVLIGWLTALATPLALLGSALLLYMGITTLRRPLAERAAQAKDEGSLLGAYSSALALTLTNPMTILSFIAVFAGLAGGHAPNRGEAILMVLGVFCGSALWWLLLAYGGGRLLARLGSRGRHWVDRLCGLLLIGFAVLIAWRLLMQP
ncbi:LysE/ArgO family amino acid transporter [Vogesella oryzae]|uniref:LysE/ArgO family amino acid transporter n=1 Tax=Vogesella oryzae TaxID=1735285 RepID=UPI0015834CC6|nr:LysE family transporter [Vogesella oryzae]